MNFTIPKTVNPDVAIDRKNASFNSEEFAAWFHGNKDILEQKRMIEGELYADLDDPLDHEFLSYEDMTSLAVKHSISAANKLKVIQNRGLVITSFPIGAAIMPTGNPLTGHILMFTKVFKDQGTPEQYEMFGRRAENFEILGSYAQTELGHGTFFHGLETRADYVPKTQEFRYWKYKSSDFLFATLTKGPCTKFFFGNKFSRRV